MKPYYDEDGITIYHADCREVLPTLTGDAVITDPPYGVDLAYGQGYDDTRDQYPAFVAWIAEVCQIAAPLVAITPGIRNLWLYPPATWVLSWHKPGSTRRSDLGGFNEWEPILFYGKKVLYHDALRLPSVANLSGSLAGEHPCPKPLRLMAWLVGELTEQGQTVIDPFMGSGTTLRAAKDLGRKAIGIEIEERYCGIAVQRLAQGVLSLE